MKLKVLPHSKEVEHLYRHHGHFHAGDAGLDLFVVEAIEFAPGETRPIHFGISCESEGGRPYFLLPRSSIAKTPLRMSNSIGLIDGGYRGELIAYCDNISRESYRLEKGRRLFQLAAMDGSPLEVEITTSLSPTSRGDGGFGSTGD